MPVIRAGDRTGIGYADRHKDLAAVPGTDGNALPVRLTVFKAGVEDALLGMIRDVLKTVGYTVISARSGRAAMEFLSRGEAFDVLLTDIVMPGQRRL